MEKKIAACLLLEDGSIFEGESFGSEGTTFGHLVFNTAHTGYEEVMTDPSYTGELVLFTTPYVGNTGITRIDAESSKIHAGGFLAREFTLKPDNCRAFFSLKEYFLHHNTIAMHRFDTRKLTLHLRNFGSQYSVLTTENKTLQHLQNILLTEKQKNKRILSFPSTKEGANLNNTFSKFSTSKKSQKLSIAVIDFGIKKSIIDNLHNNNLEPNIFHPNSSWEEIATCTPQGLFLSNGAGNPEEVVKETSICAVIKSLPDNFPVFGICMGHQIIAKSYCIETLKLPYGHHAINHPVENLQNHKSYITSQNHNYYVSENSDAFSENFEATFRHLNDGTLAGMKHKTKPIFSVQFHPESAPGPTDTTFLFEEFSRSVQKYAKFSEVIS